ncbi:MAG TPA: hypothetical protein VNX18_07860 [Bryobacteraceae bacterium]|jgi:hypothetical protein|nr:hypothetical protein [Bryobacteraceae bacterium]
MALFFLFSVALALVCTSLGYRWWMDRITRSWPVAEAKLDSGSVSSALVASRTRRRKRYLLNVKYSYFVAGSLYGGTWFKHFGTKEEADHLWKSLNELMVLVRYNPRKPERSYFDPYRDVRVGESRKA